MQIIIFDPLIVGHHVEYLRHLAQYAIEKKSFKLHFIVHPQFTHRFPKLSMEIMGHSDVTELHALAGHEYHDIKESGIIRRSLTGWNAMERRARQIKADHCVFMEINPYQPVIGLPRARRAPFSISGILFFPYCRIEPVNPSTIGSVRTWLERLRKRAQLQWVLSNRSVERIFVLNDVEAATKMREQFRKNVFVSLPDPVPPNGDEAESPEPHWMDKNWPSGRSHFLLCGALREQKGVSQLFEAIRRLEVEETCKMALHLLGKPRGKMRSRIPKMVRDLRSSCPSLSIHYEGRFLSDEELSQAIKASNVVLAPYQRTEGSSGIIGHAAKHLRPVIGPSRGLIGMLIDKYNLGITVDTTSSSALRDALRHFLNGAKDVDENAMLRYVEERTPRAFARALLTEITE